MTHGGQHSVKYSFHNDRVRLDAATVDRPQNGRGAHGNAVEDQLRMRQAGPGVAHCRRHVFRLIVANRRVGFRRISRAAKINQQHRKPHFQENPGLVPRIRFFRGVAVKQDDQRAVRRHRAIPRAQSHPVCAGEAQAAAGRAEACRRKSRARSRQMDAAKQSFQLLAEAQIFRRRRARAARDEMRQAIGLPISQDIQRGEDGCEHDHNTEPAFGLLLQSTSKCHFFHLDCNHRLSLLQHKVHFTVPFTPVMDANARAKAGI